MEKLVKVAVTDSLYHERLDFLAVVALGALLRRVSTETPVEEGGCETPLERKLFDKVLTTQWPKERLYAHVQEVLCDDFLRKAFPGVPCTLWKSVTEEYFLFCIADSVDEDTARAIAEKAKDAFIRYAGSGQWDTPPVDHVLYERADYTAALAAVKGFRCAVDAALLAPVYAARDGGKVDALYIKDVLEDILKEGGYEASTEGLHEYLEDEYVLEHLWVRDEDTYQWIYYPDSVRVWLEDQALGYLKTKGATLVTFNEYLKEPLN